MLRMIIVVIGKKNLKPGRSMTTSPGSLPSGSFEIQGHATPIATMANPMTMKIFCISGSLGCDSQTLGGPQGFQLK